MRRHRRYSGFTLIEVLIVITITAILAAVAISQFSESTIDAKLSSLKFNLHTLRAQIELYRNHHERHPPSASLVELTKPTDVHGVIGTGTAFRYGPYIQSIPANSFTGSNVVTVVNVSPATPAHTT